MISNQMVSRCGRLNADCNLFLPNHASSLSIEDKGEEVVSAVFNVIVTAFMSLLVWLVLLFVARFALKTISVSEFVVLPNLFPKIESLREDLNADMHPSFVGELGFLCTLPIGDRCARLAAYATAAILFMFICGLRWFYGRYYQHLKKIWV